MSKWKEVSISDLAKRITSGGTPSRKKNEYFGGDIPWLTTKEVKFNRIYRTEEFITAEGLQNSSAKIIEPNSIIVAMYGATAGKIAINKIPLTTNQACCNITVDNDITTYRFLYYFLLNSYERLVNLSSGAAQQNLSVGVISDIKFNLPPLPEQKAIAEVLSSLDDKIDLLHRQNKTLEQMAETLFKQWFVEEAKEDWVEGVLEDIVEVKYGKDHKKLLDGKIPVYGSGGIMRYADTSLYEKESVLIPRKGTLNNVLYINKPFWVVDTMFYTKMKKPNLAKFVYHFVKGHDLANMNVGSAVPSMTTQVLNNMPLFIPSDNLLESFEQIISPLYIKMDFNQIQISTLEKLRDTLLPKLMSGQVTVKME